MVCCFAKPLAALCGGSENHPKNTANKRSVCEVILTNLVKSNKNVLFPSFSLAEETRMFKDHNLDPLSRSLLLKRGGRKFLSIQDTTYGNG